MPRIGVGITVLSVQDVERLLLGEPEKMMSIEIKVFDYGRVNCFLVKTADHFVLIDTGLPTKRDRLERAITARVAAPET